MSEVSSYPSLLANQAALSDVLLIVDVSETGPTNSGGTTKKITLDALKTSGLLVTAEGTGIGGVTVSGTPANGDVLTAVNSGAAIWSAPALSSGLSSLLPTVVGFNAAIPLDGLKMMSSSPRVLLEATAFTVSGTPLPGAQCSVKLASNGSVAPTFTGMIEWGGSSGWSSAVGAVNNITFFNDGWSTYYSVTGDGGAAATVPVPVSALKSGISSGVASITFSAPLGSTLPDAAKLTITTTPSVGAAIVETPSSFAIVGNTLTMSTTRPATVGDTCQVNYNPATGSLATRLVSASGQPLFAWSNLVVPVQAFVGMLDSYTAGLSAVFSMRRRLTTWSGVGGDKRLFKLRHNSTTDYLVPYDIDGNPDLTGIPTTGTLVPTEIYDQTGSGLMLVPVGFSGATAPPFTPTSGPGGVPGFRSTVTAQPMMIVAAAGIGPAGINLVGAVGESTVFQVQQINSGGVFLGAFGSYMTGSSVLMDSRTDTGESRLRFTNSAAYSAVAQLTGVPFASWHQVVATKYGAAAVGAHAAKASNLRVFATSSGQLASSDVASSGADPILSANTQWHVCGTQGLNGSIMGFVEHIVYRTGLSDATRDAVASLQAADWDL